MNPSTWLEIVKENILAVSHLTIVTDSAVLPGVIQIGYYNIKDLPKSKIFKITTLKEVLEKTKCNEVALMSKDTFKRLTSSSYYLMLGGGKITIDSSVPQSLVLILPQPPEAGVTWDYTYRHYYHKIKKERIS